MKTEYEIIDVDQSNKEQYCICLEDWSDEIREAGDHKACWYEYMKDKGLGVKMVKDSDGTISGLIQYIPAQYAPLTGTDFYFIYCIWVHGHKKGIGDRRGAGMGSALLNAAEKDLRERGAAGIAAWGVSLPIWMKASWYKKHGYRVIQRDGMRNLLWKPLREDAVPPKWIEQKKRPVAVADGKVRVVSLMNGICPVTNLAYERAKAVSEEFGDEVIFSAVRTFEPDVMNEWGESDTLFINDKQIVLGPPLSKKKIRSVIGKELKKVRRN